MKGYKEICKCPFRDFTLKEFSHWNVLLKKAKLQKFANIAHEDLIQFVYYHLAIRNYEAALIFLNRCNQEVPQVIYLKLYLRYHGSSAEAHKHLCSNDNNYLDDPVKVLFNLSLKNYRPALVFFGCLSYPTSSIDDSISENKDTILNGYIQIKKFMLDSNVDIYYISTVQHVIDKLNFELGYSACCPDSLSSLAPNLKDCLFLLGVACPEVFNENSDKPIIAILRFALSGSNEALVKIIKYDMNLVDNVLSISDKTTFNQMVHIMDHIGEIEEIIKNKILLDDYKLIIELLSNLWGCIDKVLQKAVINIRMLIEHCLSRTYNYLSSGGDNVGIIMAHIGFISGAKIDIKQEYLAICKPSLLEFYSHGLLFLPVIGQPKDTTETYKKWPLDEKDNNIVDLCVPLLIDLIDNQYWPCENFCEEIVGISDNLSKTKRLCFYFIMGLSPFFWKAAIYTFGLDFFNNVTLLSKDSPLLHFYQQTEEFDYAKFAGKLGTVAYKLREYTLFIIDTAISELYELESRYFEEFMEEFDFEQFQIILEKYVAAKSNIIQKTFDICSIIPILNDILIFKKMYSDRLVIHDLYKPDGSLYSSILEDFNNKVGILDG